MKCTRCGINEATVHSYISVNNKMRQMDLCEDCANELKSNMGMGSVGGLLGELFSQPSMGLLPGLFKLFDAPTTQKLICPTCKTTGEQFIKTGFVGCPNCYNAFEPLIIQSVKKLQQSDRHIGKTPRGAVDTADEETRLRAELQAAIDSRDNARIDELVEKLKKSINNKRGEV